MTAGVTQPPGEIYVINPNEKEVAVMKRLGFILLGLLLSSIAAIADEQNVLPQQFNKIDANGDGVVTAIEVEAKPQVVNQLQLYKSFKKADFNGDGNLDFSEFSAFEEVISAE
jgi:hypothetical protein